MQNTERYLLFTVDEQVLAVNISFVERIINAVETTSIPEAPENITGIINFQGNIIPVLSLRRQFSLQERENGSSEDFVIVNTSKQIIVLTVDAVSQVVEISPEEIIPANKVLSKVEYIKGFGKSDDGIILILDLEKLIDSEEENLTDAINQYKEGEKAV